MEYILTLPPDYKQQPLPGRDEWTAVLRGGTYEQAKHHLCQKADKDAVVSCSDRYCCLGILSMMQGALETDGNKFFDSWRKSDANCDGDYEALSQGNPLFKRLGIAGEFPAGVVVHVRGLKQGWTRLSEVNDHGLNFEQIADVIDKIWYNDGPLPTKEEDE